MTRNQKVLMAGVILVAAASSFGARAAGQVAQQREITDGSYPQYVVDESYVSTDPQYVVDAPDVPTAESTASAETGADSQSTDDALEYQRLENQVGLGTAGDYTPSTPPGESK